MSARTVSNQLSSGQLIFYMSILISVITIFLGSVQGQGRGGYLKHPGRHVCVEQRPAQVPVREHQSYCKPIYKRQVHRCEGYAGMCTSFRVVYQLAHREVMTMRTRLQNVYSCCQGWTQRSPQDKGCTQAICRHACLNGGRCIRPEVCVCPPGWTGQYCQTSSTFKRRKKVKRPRPPRPSTENWPRLPQPPTAESPTTPVPIENRPPLNVDNRPLYNPTYPRRPTPSPTPKSIKPDRSENSVEEPCAHGKHKCQQQCIPTEKSYRCACYDGFTLQEDGISCSICVSCIPGYSDLVKGYKDLSDKISSLESEKEELMGNMTKMSDEYSASLHELRSDMATLSHPPDKPDSSPYVDKEGEEKSRDPEPWEQRIYSLSEQIGLLEERLEVCTCGGGILSQRASGFKKAVGIPGE